MRQHIAKLEKLALDQPETWDDPHHGQPRGEEDELPPKVLRAIKFLGLDPSEASVHPSDRGVGRSRNNLPNFSVLFTMTPRMHLTLTSEFLAKLKDQYGLESIVITKYLHLDFKLSGEDFNIEDYYRRNRLENPTTRGLPE